MGHAWQDTWVILAMETRNAYVSFGLVNSHSPRLYSPCVCVCVCVCGFAVCSGAPNCTTLNREPCAVVENTCGSCFRRHLTAPGHEGFSNEHCFGELKDYNNYNSIQPVH